jgi:cytochrome P450
MAALLWIGFMTGAQLFLLPSESQASLAQHVVRALVPFAISCILYSLWQIYVYPAFFSPLRHLPMAPGGYSPMGHSMAKFGTPTDTSLEDWIRNVPNDGMIRAKEVFGGDAVIATSPAILKRVLVEDSYNFTKDDNIRKILRLVLGDGLIVVEGDVHKSQKQILRGSFGTGPIKDLYPLFWQKSTMLLTALQSKLSSPSDLKRVPFGRWCEQVTLDIIG